MKLQILGVICVCLIAGQGWAADKIAVEERTMSTVDIPYDIRATNAMLDMVVPYGARVMLAYEEPVKAGKQAAKKVRRTVIWVRGVQASRHVQLPPLPAGKETRVKVTAWMQAEGANCDGLRRKACKSVYIMNGERRFVHIAAVDFEEPRKTDGGEEETGDAQKSQSNPFIRAFKSLFY